MSRKLIKETRPCRCEFDSACDYMSTVQGAAITPVQLQELVNRGIAVSPQNLDIVQRPSEGWAVEPIYKKGMDMATAWEMEQKAKAEVRGALHKQQKIDFLKKIESSQQTVA